MKQKVTLLAALSVCALASFIAVRIASGPEISLPETTDRRLGPRAAAKLEGNSRNPNGPQAIGQLKRLTPQPSQNSSPNEATSVGIESIMNNPNPLERSQEWLRFVKALNPGDIKGVVEEFRSKGMASRYRSEYFILLDAWAGCDPYAAIDYAQNFTSTPYARQTILATWATSDPVAAKRWAEENHEGDGVNPWMVGVIRGIAASDLDYATKLMSHMADSHRGDKFLNQAIDAVQGYYLEKGNEYVREWVQSIESDKLRQKVISNIAQNLATTDPLGTADWLQANPGKEASAMMRPVMAQMAAKNPQDAISYCESINDPTFKTQAIAGIVNNLTSVDAQTALTLMNSAPEHVGDYTILSFANNAFYQDPVIGANSIRSIEKENRRNKAYIKYLQRWMLNDLEEAIRWVNQADLPESVLTSVEKIASKIERTNQR